MTNVLYVFMLVALAIFIGQKLEVFFPDKEKHNMSLLVSYINLWVITIICLANNLFHTVR
jgi:hypothetical protein